MNHAENLQIALVPRLKALNTEAGVRVYDTVPRATDSTVTAVFPYIQLGGGDEVPVDEECWDRTETTHQIDVWSREPGYRQVKRIAGVIRAGLHEQGLNVSDNTLDRMYVITINYSRDPDGITSRARIVLQTDTQPV